MLIFFLIHLLISINNITAVEQEHLPLPAYYFSESWQQFPVVFDYYYKDEYLGDERAVASFPNEPKVLMNKSKKVYVTHDAQGTRFSISATEIPHADFQIEESIQSFLETIKTSPGIQLLSVDGHTITWTKDHRITYLTFIKSSYFIYFLNVSDEEGNFSKAEAFVNSFAITDEFSFD